MALTLRQIKELVELGEAIEHEGEYYSAYYVEVNKIDDQMQCPKCHDTFRSPFQLFFNLDKREIMYRCPNGCEMKQGLQE